MTRVKQVVIVALVVAFSVSNIDAQTRRRTRTSRQSTSAGQSILNGTYRLDAQRSDDPRAAAERATHNLQNTDQSGAIDNLINRLQSPDTIAIYRRGRNVTIASSRAPKFTFVADGQARLERTDNGTTVRARATLYSNRLEVVSSGDKNNDFSVSFDPIENGRRLSVTRRIYTEQIGQPVVVQSFYDKISNIAQWDVYGGNPSTAGGRPAVLAKNTFLLPDGTRVLAVMNDTVSSKTSHERDPFTLTVREPTQYEGATIYGYVSGIRQSGKVTGRSQVTLNFREIRLSDGRSYRFAGVLESIRNNGDQSVRVGNEGSVESSSRTKTTEERAAIGTGVGAIIGAIAGGGKGAAIGAILGAGGGAGSVYVEGRQESRLFSGAELTIRASAPHGRR